MTDDRDRAPSSDAIPEASNAAVAQRLADVGHALETTGKAYREAARVVPQLRGVKLAAYLLYLADHTQKVEDTSHALRRLLTTAARGGKAAR